MKNMGEQSIRKEVKRERERDLRGHRKWPGDAIELAYETNDQKRFQRERERKRGLWK
jgi:hypothetical protein